jgi:Gas vesicle synthesis protein GvpL/GvpF
MSTSEGPNLKYVYGVVRAREEPTVRAEGVAGGSVTLVTEDGLAALTSEVPGTELRSGREELTTHARILEEALEGGVVLPMRFGIVMEDEDSVRRDLLERHHDELLAQIEELEGKVELNVKGIYEEDVLMREVVESNSEIARLRESLQGQPEDATYYERIRLGEMVSEAVEARRNEDSERILARLSPLARAVERGEPMHERMAVNASFLVEQAQLQAFDEAVDALGAEQAGRIRFKYTGPLPPHSFVDLASVEA